VRAREREREKGESGALLRLVEKKREKRHAVLFAAKSSDHLGGRRSPVAVRSSQLAFRGIGFTITSFCEFEECTPVVASAKSALRNRYRNRNRYRQRNQK